MAGRPMKVESVLLQMAQKFCVNLGTLDRSSVDPRSNAPSM
jgi:hypothetical protein